MTLWRERDREGVIQAVKLKRTGEAEAKRDYGERFSGFLILEGGFGFSQSTSRHRCGRRILQDKA